MPPRLYCAGRQYVDRLRSSSILQALSCSYRLRAGSRQSKTCKLAAIVAAVGYSLLVGHPVEAQNSQSLVPGLLGAFGNAAAQARQAQIVKQRQEAAVAWSSIDPAFRGCLQNNAHVSIDQLIANRIPPSDPRVANLLNQCSQAIAAEQERQRQQAAAQAKAQAEAERARPQSAAKAKPVLSRQIDAAALQKRNEADLALGAGYAPSKEKVLEFDARGAREQDEIASDGVHVRVVRQNSANEISSVEMTIQSNGTQPFTYNLKDAYGIFIQIAHLMAPGERPQVLVRADYGSMGWGHYALTIFTASPTTSAWVAIPTDCCDGNPAFGVSHPNSTGSGYFLDYDLSRGTPDEDDKRKANARTFADPFDANGLREAATYRVLTMQNNGIVDVTRAPEYRAIQAYRLKEWFADVEKLTGWHADPRNAVWQALALRYLKIKALLGEFPAGWSFFTGDAGFAPSDEFARVTKIAMIKAGFAKELQFAFAPTTNIQQPLPVPLSASSEAPQISSSAAAPLANPAANDINKQQAIQAMTETAKACNPKPFYVTSCITAGMLRSGHISDIPTKGEPLGPDCSGRLMDIDGRAEAAAARILASGTITVLMDFKDAMTKECESAAAVDIPR